MTGQTIALELAEPDSLRILRAALDGAVRHQQACATYHDETGKIRRAAGDTGEANRHKRQAAEYRRREALAQQLVDQLPTAPPKGE